MSDIHTLVEDFQELPIDDQEYVAEILKKQLIESRREHLANRVAEARENYRTGRVKNGGLGELMGDLEND